jgi:hypothetical protein
MQTYDVTSALFDDLLGITVVEWFLVDEDHHVLEVHRVGGNRVDLRWKSWIRDFDAFFTPEFWCVS